MLDLVSNENGESSIFVPKLTYEVKDLRDAQNKLVRRRDPSNTHRLGVRLSASIKITSINN